ncbi:ArsR/SmtB family transcription factor [Corynebacterium mendelii]|uniref:Winged helix-turn-helix transcriptional regulator n=1 Tax=Corynebacterium mendelii TaxID=2765362 RepID=A0A939IY78_9CORY|nr:metalloregulator ArsR/SmtB family transcription factor [Corynebacterium mendelii]MBN9644392.1 winged helix-turn-helix transcriptional regulator [Corynebacterium mendelii]
MSTPASTHALTRIGKALADATRCRILLAITGGCTYPAELADNLGLTRANVSNHLACLRGCGLVTATKQGRRVRYDISSPELGHALTALGHVTLVTDPDEKCPCGCTR